jgi:hypothetical protein
MLYNWWKINSMSYWYFLHIAFRLQANFLLFTILELALMYALVQFLFLNAVSFCAIKSNSCKYVQIVDKLQWYIQSSDTVNIFSHFIMYIWLDLV